MDANKIIALLVQLLEDQRNSKIEYTIHEKHPEDKKEKTA